MHAPAEYVHPESGETIHGIKLGAGDILEATDVYDSTVGKWSPCPCPGAKIFDGFKGMWIRPTTKEQVITSAKVILTPTDQGQHGVASCGKCGNALPDVWVTTKNCPHCGIALSGTTTHPSFGGSDM